MGRHRPPDPLARLLLGALSEASVAPAWEQEGLRSAALWLLQRLRQGGARTALV